MKNTLRFVCLAILVALAIVTMRCKRQETVPTASAPPPKAAAASQADLPPNAWVVPVDVTDPPPTTPQPQGAYLHFGWETFVALNWPAKANGANGQPDSAATIGARAPNGAMIPTVWRTFRDVRTVMLEQGADPGPYTKTTKTVTIPPGCPPIDTAQTAPGFQPLVIDATKIAGAAMPLDAINQAGFTVDDVHPLVDQKGWYVITNSQINQSEYDYILQNKYYDGKNQKAAFKDQKGLKPFPRTGKEATFNPPLPAYAQYGALETKATWRVLDPKVDSIDRYYTQWGYFVQPKSKTCQAALFGLIGFHILRLTPSTPATWFWASFQQVDDVGTPFTSESTLAKPDTPNYHCPPCAAYSDGGEHPPCDYNFPPKTAEGDIPWNGGNRKNDLCQVDMIPKRPVDVQAINSSWRGKLSGTVWSYYEMVNTANPCLPGTTQPTCHTFGPLDDPKALINVTSFSNIAIESYLQKTNCHTCHAYAAGIGAPPDITGNDQIFTFVLQNAYSSDSAATAAVRQRVAKILKSPRLGKTVSQ